MTLGNHHTNAQGASLAPRRRRDDRHVTLLARDKPHATDRAAYDPFQLVTKVPREKLPHLYLDGGTDDWLVEGSQAFMRLLIEHKIPLTYAQSAGGHHAPYWTREVGHSMAVHCGIIRQHMAASRKSAAESRD